MSEFVRIGWKIFGQVWRKDWYLEFYDKLCEEGEEGTISPERDDVWTAIEALAQFYLSINESCKAYKISVITDDTLLRIFVMEIIHIQRKMVWGCSKKDL